MVLHKYDRHLKINQDLKQAKEDDSECFGVADHYRVDYNLTWRTLVNQKVALIFANKRPMAHGLLFFKPDAGEEMRQALEDPAIPKKRPNQKSESDPLHRFMFLSLLGFLGWHT
ncbi:hypothetical protein L596_026218 [Steinernema carpocapsae]|uniref:Uncharacterized protein n=1 Tax=Steinernema carpocapsae TaxID=34508 RepID=A0A4U5M0P9_STECR|nr:hypothetical protein L596_026218 [Steinernema carpocapsae]